MRLIKNGFQSASFNMALDEAIFRQPSIHPTLRLYRWSRPAFSFGYFQKISQIVNVSDCLKHNIDLVRRITGGGTVVHSWDITFSLIVPRKRNSLPESISCDYKTISQCVFHGLSKIGIDVHWPSITIEPEKMDICFINPVKYDMMIDGKKIMGIAQRRNQNAILYQSYIALDSPCESIKLLFSEELKIDTLLTRNSTDLNSHVSPKLTRHQIEQTIISSLKNGVGQDILPSKLSKDEMKLTFQLERKYRSDQWNFLSQRQ